MGLLRPKLSLERCVARTLFWGHSDLPKDDNVSPWSVDGGTQKAWPFVVSSCCDEVSRVERNPWVLPAVSVFKIGREAVGRNRQLEIQSYR